MPTLPSVIIFLLLTHKRTSTFAARESKWACACGAKNPFKARRCGKCNQWKDKRRSVPEEESAPTDEFGNILPKTHVPSDSGVLISETRRLNERGRQLCKVEGCDKLRQARNDGFCRLHFNAFAISQLKQAPAAAPAAPEDGAKVADNRKPPAATKTADWLCSCGTNNPGKQTRCGSCQRWKGGKRQTIPKKKKPKASEESATAWDCNKCGNKVLASKSRCGQCHHWKGGKRKCGWTIKGKGDDGSIPWHLEWSCCNVTYSPDKRRCESTRDCPFQLSETHFPPSRWQVPEVAWRKAHKVEGTEASAHRTTSARAPLPGLSKPAASCRNDAAGCSSGGSASACWDGACRDGTASTGVGAAAATGLRC